MWREEPALELPTPDPVEGTHARAVHEESLEKEDFSRGRNPTQEQGRSVRHPPPEEEGAAETAAPIPHPAVGKEEEEARRDSEPGTKSGAEGGAELSDISLHVLTALR